MITPTANSPDRHALRFTLSIGLLAVIVRLVLAWRTHSTGEDALITLRYAENIASGQGFVFNPGARVLGSTTPLYTLLLALFAFLRLDALTCGKVVNILADGGTCVLIARLLARPEINHPHAGRIAALLYAFTSTPISVSIGGMETGLVTCVSFSLIYAYVASNSRALYVLGAILYLLRIDGLLLFGILAAGLALRQGRIPRTELLIALAIALPWTQFALWYFGSPIPASLIAKVVAYGQGGRVSLTVLPPMPANREAFAVQFVRGGSQKILSLLLLFGAGSIFAAAYRAFRAKPLPPESPAPFAAVQGRLALPLLWLLLYYTAMLTSRVPAFGWYFLPPWPLVMATAGLGAEGFIALLASRLPSERQQSLFHLGWATLYSLVYGFGFVHLPAIQSEISLRQRQDDGLRRTIGLWLRDHSRPSERVLLEPIGYIGYYSRLPILDSIGLVSPEVLPSYRTANPLADMVTRLRPEWLCLRQNETAILGSRNTGGYTLARTFTTPETDTLFLLYHRVSP